MSTPVLTAPLAIIKVNGIAIGKMRNIRVNESLQRGRVQGIGELTPSELPALSWSGTLSCDFYNIDFKISQIPQAIIREVQTLKEWVDSVVLQEDGVTVDIFRTIAVPGSPKIGKIAGTLVPYATIAGLFLDTENFDIAEGQVSGRNQNFQYLYPITYPQ